MMKNTEWGAASYLSHSIYGKNGEVYINNNSNYMTGCGGDSASESATASCKNAFGSKTNGIYNQTTTGNISGVFDMSGGAWEAVMGINWYGSDISGLKTLYTNFYSESKWDKYYDKYYNNSSSASAYDKRILGDATGEMGPFASVRYSDGANHPKGSWYEDFGEFVGNEDNELWFYRSDYYNGLSGNRQKVGIFSFGDGTGKVDPISSYRVVLTP